MNLLYRLVIFLMAVLFMFASILLLFYGFGWATYDFLPNLLTQLHQQWQFGILFSLFFIAAVWVIYPFISNEKKVTPISKSEIGSVDITLDALDTLVNNIALEQEGVMTISNRLKTRNEGLIINLKTQIFPSKDIPAITSSLQNLVKTYIEDITGVTVCEIKVLVETVTAKETNDE